MEMFHKFLGNSLTHLLQLILISYCCHLQVALDLLTHLLEAVHYWQAGNRIYAAQGVKTYAWQVVLPGNLTKVDDGLQTHLQRCVHNATENLF